MNSTKDLNYYKNDCEEDYITTPISVLRYITELEQALQLNETAVSGSLFSEMNTEMLKISIAIQNIKQSEFIEDYTFHKTTSKKDIRTFLNSIKQQNERLVMLNQRMIRLRERFGKNYR